MTEPPTDPVPGAEARARRGRADLAGGRSTRRRHPAQGARIAAAGLGATTMLGLVGAMGYDARTSPDPAPTATGQTPPPVVVVVHRPGSSDNVRGGAAPSGAAATVLTARPTVRPASDRSPAPAASTSGSH